MKANKPLVTVGVPVYNGERFLRYTLESLLAQEFKDFELLISDNGSTDATPAICEEFARRDPRIRYIRHDVNRGASWNFKYLLDSAVGEYLMWAGSHDMWHPRFIGACLEVLAHDPEVVVAYTQAQMIDADGNPIEIMKDDVDTRGYGLVRRVRIVISNLNTGNMVYGMFRTETLRKCRIGMSFYRWDLVVLTEANILGSGALIREPLFLRREFRKPSDYENPIVTMMRVDPTIAERQKLMRTYIQMAWELVVSVDRAPVNSLVKFYLLINVVYYFTRRWYRQMWAELFHPVRLDRVTERSAL